VLDLKTGKQRTVPKLPTGVIGNLRWHENNRELGPVALRRLFD
jgi:hypothetical protein